MEMEISLQPESLSLPPKTEETLRGVLDRTAKLLDLGADTEVSILLVDNETIRNLNREYRGKDTPTDVLSFPLEEGDQADGEPVVVGGPAGRLLGDIVISIETANMQSVEYKHTLERELAFLAVHGLLHLLGHDHEKDPIAAKSMRTEEKRILTALGIER